MGSNYNLGGSVQVLRPSATRDIVHEGPLGSWPGAVSPAEVYYDQVAHGEMMEQRNLRPSRVGAQVTRAVEVMAVLESADAR